MKISTMLSYSGGFKEAAKQVSELEKAGLDLVWVAEAYGFDGPSLMGYLAALTETVEIGAAIIPIYTRTPTLIAMTAAGIDALSDGRFHLGLGASGPQVIEGFHGVPYTAPLGEKNVAMTAEVADGWIPILFIPEKARDVWGSALDEGAAKRDPSRGELMITAGGLLAIGEGEEVTRIRELQRSMVALYVGGMGAKGKNFYNELAIRYGFADEAAQIQDLYLSGRKKEAEALVPDEFLEKTTLCGPEGYIRERLAAFAEAGVTHLQVHPFPQEGQTAADLVSTVKEMLS